MFEEIAFDAIRMLILIFLIALAFLVIWGALWVHEYKRTKLTASSIRNT